MTLCEVVHCARSTARTEETTYVLKAITALSYVYIMLLFVWHTRRPCKKQEMKNAQRSRAPSLSRGMENMM